MLTTYYCEDDMDICLIADCAKSYNLSAESCLDLSTEIEINFIKESLQNLGHKVTVYTNIENFIDEIHKIKQEQVLVFNMYEGLCSRNREGLIPAICESFKIPYTGSDCFANLLTLNKYFLILFAEKLNINVPKSTRITSNADLNDLLKSWKIYPCVLKPEHEGSSVGLKKIESKEELETNLIGILNSFKQPVLLQEYIYGIDMAICILEQNNSPKLFGIKKYSDNDGKILELFDSYYKKRGNHILYTLDINDLNNNMVEQSLELYKELDLHDIARFDWKLSETGVPYLMEVTPLPDLAPNTEFTENNNFQETLNSILMSAKKRWNL